MHNGGNDRYVDCNADQIVNSKEADWGVLWACDYHFETDWDVNSHNADCNMSTDQAANSKEADWACDYHKETDTEVNGNDADCNTVDSE